MNSGKLYLVGIGPGDAGHLTPAATNAIAESDDLVGYSYYIEQVAQETTSKTLHSMELGQELERAALAVDLAYAGKTVAVVSSGDAGILAWPVRYFAFLPTGSGMALALRWKRCPAFPHCSRRQPFWVRH